MAAGYNFKNEEEVKQYLHNIGIEYRFGCYSEKLPNGKLPSRLLSSYEIEIFNSNALHILTVVCHLLGMYLYTIKKDTEQAKKVLKVNCDQHKWSFSCYKYAYLLDQERKPENLNDVRATQ